MTILTVNIQNENDLPVLQEILNRFGLIYKVNSDDNYAFTGQEIASLIKTKADFLEGKTTARDWNDIEEDLNNGLQLSC